MFFSSSLTSCLRITLGLSVHIKAKTVATPGLYPKDSKNPLTRGKVIVGKNGLTDWKNHQQEIMILIQYQIKL